MKDIQATFGSLKKNLDANNSPAAGTDAAKLQGLFGEIEAFWAALKTKDAVGFAKSAGTAAAAVSTAAQNNDIKAAQDSYSAIQKNCGSCHSAHREQIATGFRIRP
jgi:phage tail sheath gpL-like